jgi:hypothetical protein
MTERLKLSCEEARVLMGSYALGATSAAEDLAMREHLGDCAACRAEAAGMMRVTRMLSLDADPVAPPAGLRRRILDAVAADIAGDGAVANRPSDGASAALPGNGAAEPAGVPLPISAARRPPRVFWPALAAAALVVAAVMGAWNFQLQQEQPRVYTLQARGRSGEVVYWPARHQAFVDLNGLPDPGPGRVYQVWLLKDGTATGVGTARPDSAHHLVLVINRDLSGYQKVALTDEPDGGSPAPTTTPVLAQNL